jgi:uncharacterized membrane protein YdjX (TVP38/TMEM64 family)
MTTTPSAPPPPGADRDPEGRRARALGFSAVSSGLSHRVMVLVVALGVAVLLASSEAVHARILALIAAAQPVIAQHLVAGAILFVALAALSAMLVFFSSVLLVPLGVQAWGEVACFLLLWSGWALGGVITYSIGRWLGRPAIERMLPKKVLDRYEGRIPVDSSFLTAVLIQLALPSDISGYFFGLVGFPARIYFGALVVAELPYALGTVFLGVAFVQRQYVLLLSVAAVTVAFLVLVWFRRRGRRM